MDKPVILAVDDEPAVLSAVARDLRRQYGNEYRVVRADSGAAALEALRGLRLRNEPVALILADQRMPGMTGVEMLGQAIELFPDAKRVLLTAYADTEAAIKAINEVRLNHYLMKPWDPPEERLYPIVEDLLDDWRAAYQPPFEGLRVVGHRWSGPSFQVKDFLVKNLVPYRWLDIEEEEEARELVRLAELDPGTLPIVFSADGTFLVQPTSSQIAEKIGLRTRPEMPFYDLVIVGGGPAGLGAAVYGASEGLSTLLIEREAAGGQAGTSSLIENYLGFPSGLSGSELTRRALAQARRFGAEILTPLEAAGLRTQDMYRFIRLSDQAEISCHALVIASGVQYRKLEAPGVEKLVGSGIFYGGANAEAPNTRGQDVFIVGAGNSAGQAAMYLSQFARNVTILVRGDSLAAAMSQYLIDRIEETPNVHVKPNVQVVGAEGEEHLEALCLENIETGEQETVPAFGLFIFIGAMPRTEWVEGVVQRDKYGFIPTGGDVMRDGHPPSGWPLERDPFFLESNVPGIFVAGDVRQQSIKRVASAVGEGAMAVSLIHKHLAEL